MGEAQRCEPADQEGSGLHSRILFAQNSGVCVEDDAEGIRLNVGCGRVRWPGWVNIDHASGDVKADIKALPYGEESVQTICAIHVIEHLWEWEVLPALKHWHGLLKPDGKLIVELPCMDKLLGYIAETARHGKPLSGRLIWGALWGDNKYRDPSMVHKYGYMQEQVIRLFRQAGFRDIQSAMPRYHFAHRDMRIEGVK